MLTWIDLVIYSWAIVVAIVCFISMVYLGILLKGGACEFDRDRPERSRQDDACQ